ncbi:MAG: GNAT family N-acetyltransferase [Myxococcota bacterium]
MEEARRRWSESTVVADSAGPLVTVQAVLRHLTRGDAPALHCVTGDRGVMRYWHPGPDGDVAATERRIADIEAHWQRHGFGDWAVLERSGGALIGFAGLHHISDMVAVNVGYALAASHWRRGIGAEVCRLLLGHAFSVLGLPEVVAVIDPRNVASLALAGACGLSLRERCIWQGQARVVHAMTRVEWVVRGGSI